MYVRTCTRLPVEYHHSEQLIERRTGACSQQRVVRRTIACKCNTVSIFVLSYFHKITSTTNNNSSKHQRVHPTTAHRRPSCRTLLFIVCCCCCWPVLLRLFPVRRRSLPDRRSYASGTACAAYPFVPARTDATLIRPATGACLSGSFPTERQCPIEPALLLWETCWRHRRRRRHHHLGRRQAESPCGGRPPASSLVSASTKSETNNNMHAMQAQLT